jgi:hypothetical protein
VDGGGIGLGGGQERLDGLADRCHVWRVERALGEERRVPGGEDKPVALAQGISSRSARCSSISRLGAGAAFLDEAQMPCGTADVDAIFSWLR